MRRRRSVCDYCGQPMRHADYVDLGQDRKRYSPGNIHLRCMFQQGLDRRGKGEKLDDVLRANPHVAARLDRLERAAEARLRGDEAVALSILAGM